MTIRDIARLAEVSPSTVSKVINDKTHDISEETRKKILSVIEKHNYVPYKKVLDRASRDSNNVALVVDDASDIFASTLMRGVGDSCYEHGLCLMVCSTGGSVEKEQRYLHMLRKQSVRGIIRFMINDPDSGEFETLEAEGIHSVILDDYQEGPNVLKATFNNKAGGQMATRHLIEAGHTCIGYITAQMKKPYQIQRHEGYRAAMEESGLPYDESLVYASGESSRRRIGYEGAQYLMSQRVSAIFCCDDHVAAGAYAAIQEGGLRIPQDISVMGFDDTYFSEILYPPLSSIRQSAYDIGRSSMELLYAKLNDLPMESGSVQIQPTLVPRSSVQPPDARFLREKPVVAVVGEIRAEIHMDAAGGAGDVRRAQSMHTQPGGRAVKAAREALAAGNEVYLVGCVGNDEQGRQVYDSLHQSGIKMEGVLFESGHATGTALVVNRADGTREETVFPGANETLDPKRLQGLERVLKKADACWLDKALPPAAAEALATFCAENKITLNNPGAAR